MHALVSIEPTQPHVFQKRLGTGWGLKAVVLAAGIGSRMNPLTSERPKHLLPVAGKPIVRRVIEVLSQVGVEEVRVVIGYMAERIREALSDVRGIELSFSLQERPRGTADALLAARDFVDRGERFILVYGDVTVTREPLEELIRRVEEGGLDGGLIGVVRHDPWRFGTLQVDGDLLVGIAEKSKEVRPPALVNAGIYILPGEVMEVASSVPLSPRGEYELTDAVVGLVRRGRRIGVLRSEGSWWFDLGGPAELLRANVVYLKRELGDGFRLGRGSVVMRSSSLRTAFVDEFVTLGPSSSVEASALMRGSSVGRGAEVFESLVLDGAKIGEGARIERCVIGSGSVVPDGAVLIGTQDEPVVIPPGTSVQR
jgi:NDP-sugar pyrophosphorylase family protein